MKGSNSLSILGEIIRLLFWGLHDASHYKRQKHFFSIRIFFTDTDDMVNSKRVVFFEEFTKRRGTIIIN